METLSKIVRVVLRFALPIGVNLRIYPIVGVNQRQMRFWHLAGFQPRFNGLGFTISGLQSPLTREEKR